LLADWGAGFAITRAHALRLEWDGHKKMAVAATYCDRQTMAHHSVSASAFVVACGPLSSPKLLFNSGCNDHPNGMGNSAGLLGRYLHDHPREWWAVDMDAPLTSLSPPTLTRLPTPVGSSASHGRSVVRHGRQDQNRRTKATYFACRSSAPWCRRKYYVAQPKTARTSLASRTEVHIRFDEKFWTI
jgi:choline dehydrogenase-like flavoprotein